MLKRLLRSRLRRNRWAMTQPQRKQAERRNSIVSFEPLLLMSGSTIEIHAAGDIGLESMNLLIDGQVVETYDNVRQEGEVFTFHADDTITADQIRVAFTNDFYAPESNVDYNLRVDRIVIDDITFETEDPSVLGTGVYTDAGFVPGFYETEVLHGNGYFQFADKPNGQGNTVEVFARGNEGGELMRIMAQGQVLGEFEVTQNLESYRVDSQLVSPGDNVRIEFINDFWDPTAGIDRNLIVDRIALNGVAYEAEAEDVFSTGTINASGDIEPRFAESEYLHVNGYFEFPTDVAPVPESAPTTIQIAAHGDAGTEILRVFIDGVAHQELPLSTAEHIYSFTTDTYTPGDVIRVEFINDFYDPATGTDANVHIKGVAVNGQTNLHNQFLFTEGHVDYSFSDIGPEYRTMDGTANHLFDSELGSSNERLRRISSSEYADGASEVGGLTRPGARTISNTIAAQETTTANARGLSDVAWLWGQFLDHDITLSEAAKPEETFENPVPIGDPFFDPFGTGTATTDANRTLYELSESGKREQINEITAWIDGSAVYGSDNVRAAALRSFSGGRLIVTEDNLMPFNDGLPNAANGAPPGTNLFLAGDVRSNENIALASMHTLWVREHNRIADSIAAEDADLSDEEIYQQARELVCAQIQAITFNEFLPAILGDNAISTYSGYDPNVDPTIANEFSTAAYRFGHTMLTSELLRLNNDGTVAEGGHVKLRDAFFTTDIIVQHGIDSILRGATQQAANEIDNQIIDDVRNFLFGPPGAGGFDLATLNIFRGRDHGLADYNQVREDLGLARVTDFDQISSDVDVQQKLQALYDNVDDIDLWVGGLAEDHVPSSSVGETFSAIMVDQFERLRDADRFWYENRLSQAQVDQVNATSLADVIQRNTSVNGLQEDVFFV